MIERFKDENFFLLLILMFLSAPLLPIIGNYNSEPEKCCDITIKPYYCQKYCSISSKLISAFIFLIFAIILAFLTVLLSKTMIFIITIPIMIYSFIATILMVGAIIDTLLTKVEE